MTTVKTYGWLSPEKLKFINENPQVLSLLYDLGLLPEEISARVRGYVEAAVKEERERCAKIAEAHEAKHEDYVETGDGDMGTSFTCLEGEEIARKIVGGGEPVTHTFPEKCPHDRDWETCCLDDLLKMNPGLKREAIVFSKNLGWVRVPGPKSKE
jgi:hypothetical protein